MGQRSRGYIIYARLRYVLYICQRHVSRGLQRRPPGNHLYGLFHIRNAHIVEHDYIGAGEERFIHLLKIFHLHLNLDGDGDASPDIGHGSRDAARCGNMVFLYQGPIEEPKTVAVAAAGPDRLRLN